MEEGGESSSSKHGGTPGWSRRTLAEASCPAPPRRRRSLITVDGVDGLLCIALYLYGVTV